MKFPMKTTDGKWINWSEAPLYDPYYSGEEWEWSAFKRKYKLPDNTPHPQDQGWYVEPDDGGFNGPSLSLLASPEAVKLYNELLKLDGIVDSKLKGDDGLNDDHQPYYDFHIYDTASETYIGVKSRGANKFRVSVACRNLPGYDIKDKEMTYQQIKDLVDDLYDEGHTALKSNGFDMKHVTYGPDTYALGDEFDNRPNDWWKQKKYTDEDAYRRATHHESLDTLKEAYTVKFGYATEERKPETFNTLEDAVKFINDGIKKKDAEHFVLVDADGKEMIWLDHYRDRNNSDVGYTVSRQDNKTDIEFNKDTGLKIKEKEVAVEDNKAMRGIIVSELFKIKGYSAAQLVNTFRFVDSKKEPTKVDFENKIVYYDDYAERPDIAKDVLTQYKAKNESLADSWYKNDIDEDLDSSRILHTKPSGEYLEVNSSGHGYAAYNKYNVYIGHISADSDEEAIAEFIKEEPKYESLEQDQLTELFGFGKKKNLKRYIVGIASDRSNSVDIGKLITRVEAILKQNTDDIKAYRDNVETSRRRYFAHFTHANFEFTCDEKTYERVKQLVALIHPEDVELHRDGELTRSTIDNLIDWGVVSSKVESLDPNTEDWYKIEW